MGSLEEVGVSYPLDVVQQFDGSGLQQLSPQEEGGAWGRGMTTLPDSQSHSNTCNSNPYGQSHSQKCHSNIPTCTANLIPRSVTLTHIASLIPRSVTLTHIASLIPRRVTHYDLPCIPRANQSSLFIG